MTGSVLACLVLLNLTALLVMHQDKVRAQGHRGRVPEKWLWTMAWLGGSPGILLGMRRYHHKTRKAVFVYGMPLLLLGQMALLCFWLLRKYY